VGALPLFLGDDMNQIEEIIEYVNADQQYSSLCEFVGPANAHDIVAQVLNGAPACEAARSTPGGNNMDFGHPIIILAALSTVIKNTLDIRKMLRLPPENGGGKTNQSLVLSEQEIERIVVNTLKRSGSIK
jgi:hypothetical protein